MRATSECSVYQRSREMEDSNTSPDITSNFNTISSEKIKSEDNNVVLPAYSYIKYWFLIKYIVLFITMAVDLTLNSTVEYEDIIETGGENQLSSSSVILVLM